MTGHVMEFPETFEEFAKAYSIVDRKEVYTNGSKLIPVFRVKQWLENTELRQNRVDRNALLALADEIEDNDVTYCVSAQYVLDSYASRIREALGVSDG